jgi:CrcB protein
VVALGGALGSVLRYLVALLAKDRGWTAFPWATLAVNVVGCFAITLILTIAAATTMRDQLRLFLTTGIMGGLTTYSTFDYEMSGFFVGGQWARGGAYLATTLVGCFAAGLLGLAAARVVLD